MVGTIRKRRGKCHIVVFVIQMASEVASRLYVGGLLQENPLAPLQPGVCSKRRTSRPDPESLKLRAFTNLVLARL